MLGLSLSPLLSYVENYENASQRYGSVETERKKQSGHKRRSQANHLSTVRLIDIYETQRKRSSNEYNHQNGEKKGKKRKRM